MGPQGARAAGIRAAGTRRCRGCPRACAPPANARARGGWGKEAIRQGSGREPVVVAALCRPRQHVVSYGPSVLACEIAAGSLPSGMSTTRAVVLETGSGQGAWPGAHPCVEDDRHAVLVQGGGAREAAVLGRRLVWVGGMFQSAQCSHAWARHAACTSARGAPRAAPIAWQCAHACLPHAKAAFWLHEPLAAAHARWRGPAPTHLVEAAGRGREGHGQVTPVDEVLADGVAPAEAPLPGGAAWDVLVEQVVGVSHQEGACTHRTGHRPVAGSHG